MLRLYIILVFTFFIVEENKAQLIKNKGDNEATELQFGSSRIINGHSDKILSKSELEFRVEHKFGDIAGEFGGFSTFYGLDNSSDIRIALEYGVLDNIMIGMGRNKGAGPYRGLLDGFIKANITQQTENNSMPFSSSLLLSSTLVYSERTNDLTSINSYPEFQHRMAYASQLILTRNFFDRIIFSLNPTYVHRNLVTPDDQNGLFSLGISGYVKITEKFGILSEYYYNLNEENKREEYQNSLSFALEWRTFGHVFSIYASNARGFTEQQFIPYTPSNWLDGGFRLGFAIVRKFEF